MTGEEPPARVCVWMCVGGFVYILWCGVVLSAIGLVVSNMCMFPVCEWVVG